MKDNEIFCEKKLYVDSLDEVLHVKIYKPVKRIEKPGYECHIQIESKNGTVNLDDRSIGVDSVQAVVLAFMLLGANMHYYNRTYYNGELTSIKGKPEPFPDSFGFIKNFPD